jgi:dienelactone hydrolase
MKKVISIPLKEGSLCANLQIPQEPKGLVIFAHGSSSSRLSQRSNYIADLLNQSGMATLLPDLLVPAEDEFYSNRFNITLLGSRLAAITRWSREQPLLRGLPVGYSGGGTGAASALHASVLLNNDPVIRAVVSYGGWLDISMTSLSKIKAPILFLVGSLSRSVMEGNQQVYEYLKGDKKMEIIEGASDLFEEPGKLQEAGFMATEWLQQYLLEDWEPYQNFMPACDKKGNGGFFPRKGEIFS